MIFYYIITAALSLVFSATYIIIYKKRFNICFTFLQVLIPVVCCAALYRSITKTADEALYATYIIYIAGCYFMPLLLFGILSLCDIKIKKWWVASSIIVETILYFFIVTTKYTKWFYKSYDIGTSQGVTILIKEYAFMHTITYIFIILFLVLIIGVLIYSLLEKNKAVKKYIAILGALGFISVALFLGSRYILGTGQEDTVTYVICQLIILYISKDSSYYYLDSYMLDTLGHGKGVGVITFDSKQRLLVCNEEAEKWFPELKELHVGAQVANAEGINPRFSEWFEKFENKEVTNITDIVKCGELSIKFDIDYRSIDDKMCYCFLLTDDTPQQELLRVLNKNIEKVTGTVKKYLDPSLLENLLDENIANSDGEEFNIAVMFADLRGFTAMTESIEAKETVQILNKYLTIAEQAIHKYNGILDKYVGDEVMAFWVDIKNNGEAALLCAKAALEIKNTLVSMEDEIYSGFAKELFYGIGLNYGVAILGNVGSRTRKDYTVIGDTVNVAARMEAIAPKNTIYITEAYKNVLGDNAEIVTAEDRLRVKGKTAPLTVYELKSIKNTTEKYLTQRNDIDIVTQKSNGPVLYICGCRGSYPISGVRFSQFGGETTCFVIKHKQHAIVIDAGTGFYNARRLLEDCTQIDVILTHMHYDHCIGLLNWELFPSGVTPTFYGGFSKWGGENTLHTLFEPPFWPVDNSKGKLIDVPSDDTPVQISEGVTARFFDAPHPNFAKLVVLEISGKRICVLADSESYDGIPFKYIKGCDFLIYDGMFDDAEYIRNIGRGHSTWQEGVRLAQKTGVKQLIISHHNWESSDAVLIDREEKARLMYPATSFARVGEKFEI